MGAAGRCLGSKVPMRPWNVCLSGSLDCIIPQGPVRCFPHLFSSGFLRSWDSVWGWMDGALPSFRRCRRHKLLVAAGVGRGSPPLPASTLDPSTGILVELGCSPWLKLLQAHLSAALVWVSLCLTPLQPDLGPAVTCSFGPFGFYFLFFKVERIARI